MLSETNLLSVRQRINYNTLLIIYKVRNGLMPEYLNRFFNALSDSQPYSLRNPSRLRPQRTYTSAAQNSMIYRGVLMFNELMCEKQEILNSELNEFKSELKLYVKNKF
jgi:hypothetical protein